MRRILRIVTVVSGVACAGMVALLAVSYQLDAWKPGVAVTSRFHVGFFEGAVWFYSDKVPYHGSIILMGSDKGVPYPDSYVSRRDSAWCWEPGELDFGRLTRVGERGEIVGKETFGDFPGIYYRRFEWPDERPLWTLMVSLWYPIGFLVILPAVWFFRNLQLRRKPGEKE